MKRFAINLKNGTSCIAKSLPNLISGKFTTRTEIEQHFNVKFVKYLRQGNELYEEV